MNEQDLQSIVAKVIHEISGTTRNVQTTSAPSINTGVSLPVITIGKGVFENMDDAIAAAKEAQRKLRMMPNEFREQIITRIREKIRENADILAQMGVAETGMGRVGHKVLKHQLVADKTP